MNWETFLCIGDSITIGARSYLGYPDYLVDYLQKSTPSKWNLINHAVSGYRCIDISRELTANFSNIKNQNPSIATILIGTNDVKTGTSVELYRIAYEQLIVTTKLLVPYNHVYLITIPQLGKGIKYPYKYAMNDLLPSYNAVIRELAAKYSLQVIDLKLTPNCLFDGVHLNEKGSQCVGAQISKVILKDKGYEDIAD